MRRGIFGDRISRSARGERCARITARMAMPGISFRTSTPARAHIAGTKTASAEFPTIKDGIDLVSQYLELGRRRKQTHAAQERRRWSQRNHYRESSATRGLRTDLRFGRRCFFHRKREQRATALGTSERKAVRERFDQRLSR